MNRFRWSCLLLPAGIAWGAMLPLSAAVIREAEFEGRPQFVIETDGVDYWLDRRGGGLAKLIDRDGRDWISFRRDPLAKFPESAAAGYRGLPNAVFGQGNPEAGAGHPGFDRCESSLVSSNVIRTTSHSGSWAWTWTFDATHVRLRFERGEADRPWWFLYEGTPGGRYLPREQYWGTDLDGLRTDRPDIGHQRFGRWRWAYFGDRSVPRVLAVAQVQADELDDTFWYLGSGEGGAIDSADGMVVFGFGRGAGTRSLLRELPLEFIVMLIEVPAGPESATVAVRTALEPLIEGGQSN